MFIDDITEYATTLLSHNRNNIITEDFNLHISDANDIDAAIFTETCEALGLYQHITFPTHKSGNKLDLLLTKIASDATVLRTHCEPFISDHAAVLGQLNINKFTGKRQSIIVRAIKDITTEQWISESEDQDLHLSEDFDEMVTSLNMAFKTVLDNLAPERKYSNRLDLSARGMTLG